MNDLLIIRHGGHYAARERAVAEPVLHDGKLVQGVRGAAAAGLRLTLPGSALALALATKALLDVIAPL